MKHLLLIGCVLFTTPSLAQWAQLTTPTTANIVSSSFINDDEGWIGTTNSGQAFIYHTSDGGLAWDSITVSNGANGASYVCFVSPSTGYVVVNTIAVKTIDGGITWDPLSLPGIPYYAPFFVNEDTGFISGNDEIYKTTDGGQSWRTYAIQYGAPFYSMDFLNGSQGAGCGYDDYPFSTIDGGMTWDIVNDGGLWSYFYAVSFKPDGHLYYTGYEDVFSDITYFIMGQNGYSDDELDYLYAIHWFDNDRCYAAGGSGYIVSTEDGGINWSKLKLPELFGLPDQTLHTISGFDDVYIFGDGGSAFKLSSQPLCALSAQFSYTINELDAQFTDQTVNATEWLWDFGDSTGSTDPNPAHTFPSDGIYHVCLFAANDTCQYGYANCQDVFICTSNSSQNFDGSLDYSFNGSGYVSNFFDGYYQECRSVAVQPDHKILGLDFGLGSELARYLPDGTPDSSFDGDGIFSQQSDYSGQVVKINSSGQVLIGGESLGDPLYVTRLNTDGSYDLSFGNDGIITMDPNGSTTYESLIDMAVQPDDKIVVLSHLTYGSNEFTQLIRLNTDGSPDNSFAANGLANLASNNFRFANATTGALLIQPDGKFIMAGETNLPQTKIAVARMNVDGTTDVTFDGDGIVEVDISAMDYQDYAVSAIYQPDGKVVVVGNSQGTMVVLRFNTDGSFDPTFGTNGILLLNPYNGWTVATGIELQPDGKIIILGNIDFYPPYKTLLVRLNPDGTYDPTFGNDGMVMTSINCGDTYSFDIALDESNIYLGGTSEAVGWYILNYNNDGCSPVSAGFTYSATDLTTQFSDQTIGSTSWQWDFGDGVTSTDQNPIHTYAQPGSYEVCLIASNSCSADTSCELLTIVATAIQSQDEDFRLGIFPNPFSDNTAVQFTLIRPSQVSISVFSVDGKEIRSLMQNDLSEGNHQCFLSSNGIAPGIYFVRVTTDYVTVEKKLVIQ